MFAGELRKQKALFAAVDAIALLAAFGAALAIHDPAHAQETRLLGADARWLLAGVVAVVVIWVLVFRACDLYRMRAGGIKEATALVKACSIAAVLTLLGGFFVAHVEVSRLTVALGYLFSIPLVLIARSVERSMVRRLYANPKITIPLVVIGFNDVGRYLFDQVCDAMTFYEPVGFVDDTTEPSQYRGYPVLQGVSTLAELGRVHPSLEAAIALPDESRSRHETIIEMCEEHRIRWWLVPWVFNAPPAGLRVDMIGVVPLLTMRGSNIEGLNFLVKRAFDILTASVLLVLTSPFLLIGALAVWLEDGSPVLFRQVRIGIHGERFNFLKLRSMRVASADNVHREYVRKWINSGEAAAANGGDGSNGTNGNGVYKLTNDDRITRVGRILRRYRIDELPQLINVLRGDMSLIGPRPGLPYELEDYKGWHRRRLDAVPGITGLWQVSGGNRLSFDDMVRLDVKYIEDWSLVSDLKILARTVPVMLRGEGL